MKILRLFTFLAVTSSTVLGQNYETHRISGSLEPCYTQIGYYDYNTGGLAVHLNYQINLSSWFSLRTQLSASAFLPIRSLDIFYPVGGSNDDYESVFYEYYYKRSSFSVAPVFYYRLDDLSIFVGSDIGIGKTFKRTKRTHFDGLMLNPGVSIIESEKSNESITVWGYAPFIGIGFPIGDYSRSNSEMEVSIRRDSWQKFDPTPWESEYVNLVSYGLQVAYIYNF